MDSISIRYGESLTLPFDAADITYTSADMYIGKPGQAYVLTKHAELTLGVGVFEFDTTDTELPLGTYYYQINITDDTGYTKKFPQPEEDCSSCEDEFPEFIVNEALDKIEVS